MPPTPMLATLYDGHPDEGGVELIGARIPVELEAELGGRPRIVDDLVLVLAAPATHFAILTPSGQPLFTWEFVGGRQPAGERVHVPAGWPMPLYMIDPSRN